MPQTDTRQHAHDLIDRIAQSQIANAISVLETMLDPLASVPHEDEPVSEEERLAVANSKEWLKRNDPIPHEDVLAEFGLTDEDVRRMEQTSIESSTTAR